MNPKFILKEDWFLTIPFTNKKIKIFDKGAIFEANENNEYIIKSVEAGVNLSPKSDAMIAAKDENGNLLFDIIEEKDEQPIELVIEEVPEDDDEQVKRWRIQLDVNTTRKKLKDIERFINDNIKKLL